MLITPPMCFTCDNANRVIQAIDRAMTEIEKGASEAGLTMASFGEGKINIPLNVLSSTSTFSDDSDSDSEPANKRARYQEYEGVD